MTLATRIWNLRVRIAWAILPGSRKHVSVHDADEFCPRCK